MSEPLSHDSAAGTTLGTMLARIVAEIDAAAETAADLQSALSPLLAQSGTALASQRIQGLDLLEQTLRDLAAVLGDMASVPAASHPLEGERALARCKLAAVARRLSGDASEAPLDELELF